MPSFLTSIHITNVLDLGVLFVVWFVFFKCAHLLVTLLRHEPLIGWAIGPLGVTIMFLHEPSTLYIWLDVLFPAIVAGSVLYVGLFTPLAPVALPHHPVFEAFVIACGILIMSTTDIVNAFRDLRHPLWGEARVLRSIQALRTSCAKIHFTPFGYSYLSDHFGSNPSELLQAIM
jgi:hypothetical protein